MLEFFASFLSKCKKEYPTLLITSSAKNPEWISTLDAQKLVVGMSDFTCCQRNHTTFKDTKMSCDRYVCRSILADTIQSKVLHLVKNSNLKFARLHVVMRERWLRVRETRGYEDKDNTKTTTLMTTKDDLKTCKQELMWDDKKDGQIKTWKDRFDLSILWFVVSMNRLKAVKEILASYKESALQELLSHRIPKSGIVEFSIRVCLDVFDVIASYLYFSFFLSLSLSLSLLHRHT